MGLKKKSTKSTEVEIDVITTDVKVQKQKIVKKSLSAKAMEEKQTLLDSVRVAILTKYGSNSLRSGADMKVTRYLRIPTGCVELDDKIGGGIPIGKAVMIAGDYSAGKSTLTDHIVAQAQNLSLTWDWVNRFVVKGREQTELMESSVSGLTVAYMDVEGTKDVEWAEGIGVDFDDVLYSTPEGQEETMDLMFRLQQEGINLIILDSVDALVPTKEYNNEDSKESYQMGTKAKLNGTMMRKFTNYNNKLMREGKLPCTLILLNQLRSKIGAYGNPDFTGGGRALDFYPSVHIFLRKGDMIKLGTGQDADIVGQEVKFSIPKNKTYKPRQTGEFDLYFAETDEFFAGQIDNVKSLIILGIEYGVLERAGSWFKLDGENLAQGTEKLVTYIKAKPEIYDTILQRVTAIREGATK